MKKLRVNIMYLAFNNFSSLYIFFFFLSGSIQLYKNMENHAEWHSYQTQFPPQCFKVILRWF